MTLEFHTHTLFMVILPLLRGGEKDTPAKQPLHPDALLVDSVPEISHQETLRLMNL